MAAPEKVVGLNLDAKKFLQSLQALVEAIRAASKDIEVTLGKSIGKGVGSVLSDLDDVGTKTIDKFSQQVQAHIDRIDYSVTKMGDVARKRFQELINLQRDLTGGDKSTFGVNAATISGLSQGKPVIDQAALGTLNRMVDEARLYEKAILDAAKAEEKMNIAIGTDKLRAMEQVAKSEAAAAKDAQKAQADAIRAVEQHNNGVRALLGTHESISASISKWVIGLGAGIVFYRAIRDTVREIESLISGFVKLGIDYTKTEEDSLAILTGLLAANYTLTDQQGKQIEGAGKANILQEKAVALFKELQEAAKGTRFSTQELVQTYQQITEPAVRYKKSTEDVLHLTVLATAAAKSLGMNMKEAGTELAALLSGRGGENKLATGVGITQGEIEKLRQLLLSPSGLSQAGAMWDRIVERFTTFAAANVGADQSLASIENRFKEILGRLSAGVEAPFFAAFREFVQTAERFLQSDSAKEFFSVLRGAGTGVLGSLQQQGKALAGGGTDGLNSFVIGLGKLLEALISLFGFLARITKATVEWVGANELLIKSAAVLFAIIEGGKAFVTIEKIIASTAQSTSIFAKALEGLVGWLIPAEMRLQQVTTTAGVAGVAARTGATSFEALGFAIRGALSATIIGAAVAGLGLLIEKLFQMAQAARDAKAASDAFKAGNFDEAALARQEQLNQALDTGNVGDASDAAKGLTVIGDERMKQALDALEAVKKVKDQTSREATDLKRNALNMIQSAVEAEEAADRANKKILNLVGSRITPRLTQPDMLKATLEHPDVKRALENQADLVKVRANLEELNRLRQELEGVEKSILQPNPPPPEVKYEKQSFKDPFEDRVAAFKAMLAVETKEDELAVARRDMVQEEAVQRQEKREAELTYFVQMEIARRQAAFEKWQQDQHKNPIDKDAADPKTVQELQERFNKEAIAAQDSARIAMLNSQISLENRKQAFDQLITQYQDNLTSKEDEVIGAASDKATDQFKQMIDRLAAMKPTTEQQYAEQQDAIARARAIQQRFGTVANITSDFRDAGFQLNELKQQESELDLQFQRNEISATHYAEALEHLQAQQRALLIQQREDLSRQRNLLTSNPDGSAVDPEKNRAAVQALDSQISAIDAKLAAMPGLVEKVRQAFASWASTTEQFAQMTHMFDAWGTAFSGWADAIGNAVRNVQQFFTFIQQARQMLADLKTAIDAMRGSQGGQNGSGGGSVVGAALSSANVYVAAAIIAISVASKMYRDAVEESAQRIADAYKDTVQGINEGSVALGNGIASLRSTRQSLVAQLSQSKSGREALDQALPNLDQQIEQLQLSINRIRKSFQDMLEVSRLGSGPFADFAKMLMDLQRQTKEYLDTFVEGTAEWKEAMNSVHELFSNTIRSAKENLESQMTGFEQEAVAAAQRVIDLMDQRDSLIEQQQQLQEQYQSLQEDKEQLQVDFAKAQRQFEKERIDNAQKVLDTEKQIADVIRKAADDEAQIRQRGVLEAQETIAQQKAREISNVRYDSSDRLNQLEKSLKELLDPTEFNERVNESLKSFQKRSEELSKQEVSLRKQNERLQQQLTLNGIDLETARAIAAVEGSMFNISGNRFDLERRRGELEYAQAQTQVARWSQVQALIRNIIDNGNGVLFNPPPGFPQIRVQIGDIIINNQDMSTNSNPNPLPGGGGGGGGAGGGEGSPGRGGEPPPTRRENSYYSRVYGYYPR